MTTYYRYTNSETGSTDVPWMMFAADRDEVSSGYGCYAYAATDDNAVDAADLIAEIAAALADCEDEYMRDNASEIAAMAAPAKIVDAAGLWDYSDAVQVVWDKVLEPRGIMAVRTPDGLVVFDSERVGRIED